MQIHSKTKWPPAASSLGEILRKPGRLPSREQRRAPRLERRVSHPPRSPLTPMTLKRVRELVDNMRPPAVVRWRRSFLAANLNGTAAEKLHLVFRQLAALTAGCRITTLKLFWEDFGVYEDVGSHVCYLQCKLTRQDSESLAGELAQCPAPTHLHLGHNYIRAGGAESLAGRLGQCAVLAHLNLCDNEIDAAGAESIAGVLGQCPALAHLNLSDNNGIEPVGEGRLRALWRGQASGCL